jgi:hypothetical protein
VAWYSMGTRGSYCGVNRWGREAEHSIANSADVKNTWLYTSTPPYAFMAECLIKDRSNFTFYSIELLLCKCLAMVSDHKIKNIFTIRLFSLLFTGPTRDKTT